MKNFSVFSVTKTHFEKNKEQLWAAELSKSTNDAAKEEAFSVSTPVKYYLSDQQDQGRGRGHNSWSDVGAGNALLLSQSYDVKGAPQPITSPLVGLYVFESLSEFFPNAKLSLKAPNDIYSADKKIAGILVEVSQMGDAFRLIIGLGLNVFASPKEHVHASHLSEHAEVNENIWLKFIAHLTKNLSQASRACLATHLNESERQRLAAALNRNPLQLKKIENVSPFGDLVTGEGTTSWRDL